MSQETHVTPPSYLPVLGSVALLLLMIGLGNWLHGAAIGYGFTAIGFGLLLWTIIQWFAVVIEENRTVLAGDAVLDRSMRWSMIWFIFTEVMFFAAFFGVLFYIRTWVLPQLSGLVESKIMTHTMLWPNFKATWPLESTPAPDLVKAPGMVMKAAGIPVINTAILLLSGVTITLSHFALIHNHIQKAKRYLLLTIALGVVFLGLQVLEYHHAYAGGLTLSSGIYGNIFFMMTGFHGLHVLIGSVILGVIYHRLSLGHLSDQSHFAFEAAAWYWHFVDVVWLALFVFVYWV
ncbi:cytochrome c oxidase subunit 3 [Candidatus Synchoanobacter obligatus]|uniref:cytochrome-c oxidase n=1 Tax=Candidatus Synchoanobacter obligatus TaxID=2919597 RepID=A0ABT1L4E5_9GAMM|nr:cytochrome c oxidase subunit 3 [Candidatus Synchoanobacter obligatus]MCP8352037.1 cytochrome c oxidase subunit 3 [Candidatus Synchoanobacter obligatus]